MHGIERHIHEERFIMALSRFDQAYGFIRDQLGRVALFIDGALIAMPVVNGIASRSIMHDCLGVVVDPPGVVAVLIVEALPHGQMLR